MKSGISAKECLITVPGDEIAGISGQHDVGDLSLGPQPERDHFVNVNKMV